MAETGAVALWTPDKRARLALAGRVAIYVGRLIKDNWPTPDWLPYTPGDIFFLMVETTYMRCRGRSAIACRHTFEERSRVCCGGVYASPTASA